MSLYTVLGVSASASEAEIERAYRRLARRFHPGINPGDRVAEQMYEQIQEAYRVLGDAERRRDYDRGAAAPAVRVDAAVSFEGFDFSSPAEGALAATFSELFAGVFQHAAREATTPTTGSDIALAVTVPFEDAMRGTSTSVSVTRQDRCSACGGSGRVSRAASLCPGCGGEGVRRWARGHMVFTQPCEMCGGEGRAVSEPCRNCRSAGLVSKTEVIAVPIPAGIESGTRVAVPGRGHAGALGGPAGDLYVTIDVADHPYLRRDGRDLHVTVPVAVHEAALGGVIDVPALGGLHRVRIPAGSNSGQQVHVPGEGVGAAHAGMGSPDAGDLVVTLQIVLPARLDDRSKALLREFGRLNADDVRRDWLPPAEPAGAGGQRAE